MWRNLISILCTLTWASKAASRYVPNVTKSIIKGVEGPIYLDWPDFVPFGNSDTLILTFRNRLHVSLDDGSHWQTISGIEGTEMEVFIDQFHQGRAFVSDRSSGISEIHITEDKGKHWRKASLPSDAELNRTGCSPTTHPFNEKLVLLDCSITRMKSPEGQRLYFGKNILYGSDDAGKSFRRITSSESFDDRTECYFAAPEVSTSEDDGIYCIQTDERSEDTHVQSLNQSATDLLENGPQSVGTLFYTTVFGESKKTFDELNGFSVEEVFILPSGVAVVTTDSNNAFNKPQKLWIFRNGFFKVAHLPESLVIRRVQNLSEDEQNRLLLDAYVQYNGNSKGSRRQLVSDSSGLSFSFQEPVLHLDDQHIMTCEQIGNLKGTLWRTFKISNNTEEIIQASGHTISEKASNPKATLCKAIEKKANWFQETLSLLNWLLKFVHLLKNSVYTGPTIRLQHRTKGSFDNGKTWTNLKVVDPSGNHRRLFKCNIDDVENCSFQVAHAYLRTGSAGILMKRGTVGKYYDSDTYENDNDMTFISRDGGLSWELAFEFAVKARQLDFGNIIVAIPENTSTYAKFFFSLDQGRTWAEYHFEKPIRANSVRFYRRGLKIFMGFDAFENGMFGGFNQKSMGYIFYSIDFSNAFDGTACTKDDWETWNLSNGTCIEGKKYSFNRRKANSQCLMMKTFEQLELHEEGCV